MEVWSTGPGITGGKLTWGTRKQSKSVFFSCLPEPWLRASHWTRLANRTIWRWVAAEPGFIYWRVYELMGCWWGAWDRYVAIMKLEAEETQAHTHRETDRGAHGIVHYIKGNQTAGAVSLIWFEIYRSQVHELQRGSLEPARFSMLTIFECKQTVGNDLDQKLVISRSLFTVSLQGNFEAELWMNCLQI